MILNSNLGKTKMHTERRLLTETVFSVDLWSKPSCQLQLMT